MARQWMTLTLTVVVCALCLFHSVSSDTDMDSLWVKIDVSHIPGADRDIIGEDVYVSTDLGTLRGKRRPADHLTGNSDISHVTWFTGVPYAEPPTGSARLVRTVSKQPWRGVLNATRLGPVCPQTAFAVYAQRHLQSEDCLYLNIYSPYSSAAPNRRYPVLVFIHGGSYQAGGSSIYNGHYLAQFGIVVVVINYRLGLLGFMCLPDSALSGNYGLWDQVEALTWVQKHISAFAGDPDHVTVSGNSAGASSVGLLAVSPLTEGLFQQAIVQSGSPFSYWAAHEQHDRLSSYFSQLTASMGCSPGGNEHGGGEGSFGRAENGGGGDSGGWGGGDIGAAVDDVEQCLRRLDWQIFADFEDSDLPRLSPSGTDNMPCYDGAMFPLPIRHMLHSSHPLPLRALMTGVTRNEWSRNMGWFLTDLLYTRDDLDRDLRDGIDLVTFEAAVHHVMKRRFGWPQVVADVVLHAYTNWSALGHPESNRDSYIQMMSDLSMVTPTVELADNFADRQVPVYVYQFSHVSSSMEESFLGSYHSSELNYLFGATFTGIDVDSYNEVIHNYTDTDRDVSIRMMTQWSNFVKFGNPNGQGEGAWPPFSKSSGDYVDVTTSGGVPKRHLHADKVALWRELVPRLAGRQTHDPHRPFQRIDGGPSVVLLPWAVAAVSVCLAAIFASLACYCRGLAYRSKRYQASRLRPTVL